DTIADLVVENAYLNVGGTVSSFPGIDLLVGSQMVFESNKYNIGIQIVLNRVLTDNLKTSRVN
ncbi:hypothetical protein GW17_00056149, partial [Ensete ventricosum]